MTLERAVCLAVTFLLVTSAVADSLDRWNWRNPSPPLNPLAAIAYANGTFVAVGGRFGYILRSTDGTNWTRQWTPTDEITVEEIRSFWLYGVAWGNGRWVAVGEGGVVLSSPDARCWTRHDSGIVQRLNAVAYGNGTFVAVGTGGRILTSTDGMTWAIRTPGVTTELRAVTHGNNMWVVVGGQISVFGIPEEDALLTSPDGVTWTDRSAETPNFPAQSLHGVTYGNNIFVAVGWSLASQEGFSIYTSTDAVNWQQQPTGLFGINSMDLTAVGFGNGKFLAAGFGRLSSVDGTNWSRVPNVYYYFAGAGIIYENDRWVIARSIGVSWDDHGRIETSVDGVNWHLQRQGTAENLSGIEFAPELGVAVGAGGTIVTSSNALRWDLQVSGTSNWLYGVAHQSNRWVAVGERGTILTSTNARDWETQNSGITNSLLGVAAGAGQFVAIGSAGLILVSTNGVTWTQHNGDTLLDLYSVDYGDGVWVAVGDRGLVSSSTNGTAWVQRSGALGTYLFGVKYGGNQWIAVGSEVSGQREDSTVLTSSNAIDWTKQTLPYGGQLRDVAFGDGYFVITGRPAAAGPSTIFTSTNGTNWRVRIPDSQAHFFGIGYFRNTFVVAGNYGAILQSSPLRGSASLEEPRRAQSGQMSFTVRRDTKVPYRIEGTTDFATWNLLGTITNDCECNLFQDDLGDQRFYRAVQSD